MSLKKGDRIDWECDVVNDGKVPLHFGDPLHTAEMCNVFGAYTPSDGTVWQAANL